MFHSFSMAPFAVLRLGWFAYWMLAARNVKATRRREPVTTFLLNRVFVIVSLLLLLFPHLPPRWLEEHFIAPATAPYAAGLIMTAAGLGFSVWARVHLGRNWSALVTVKQDHELIRTGPYGLVRHPIYTGVLLAILGTAVAIGEWRALIAFSLITIGFVLKLRSEERFMSQTFGSNTRAIAPLCPP